MPKRPQSGDPTPKRRRRNAGDAEGVAPDAEDDEEAMVPAALTRKIISQARQQQEEMEASILQQILQPDAYERCEFAAAASFARP